jgi:hypothetical protein
MVFDRNFAQCDWEGDNTPVFERSIEINAARLHSDRWTDRWTDRGDETGTAATHLTGAYAV